MPSTEEEEEEVRVLTLPLQAHHAMEKMEEFVYKVKGFGLPALSWSRWLQLPFSPAQSHSGFRVPCSGSPPLPLLLLS